MMLLVALVGLTQKMAQPLALGPKTVSRRAALLSTAVWVPHPTVCHGEARPERQKVEEALGVLRDLTTDDAKFQEVVAGGGDNLRRQLGTVGQASPLFGIEKTLVALMAEVEDEVDYNENYERFVIALRAADADAYSANFVEFSAAKATPEGYFRSARRELKVACASLANIAAILAAS